MCKKTIFLAFLFVLLPISIVCADELETISFISPEKSDWKITLGGHFNKPGIISPNETIFYFTGNSTQYPFFDSFRYRFIGRTGEKTFEMRYEFASNTSPIKKDEKINMYFDDNLSHLSFSPFKGPKYTNCTEEDKVFLKIVKLEGNQLECQIILPNCLKPTGGLK